MTDQSKLRSGNTAIPRETEHSDFRCEGCATDALHLESGYCRDCWGKKTEAPVCPATYEAVVEQGGYCPICGGPDIEHRSEVPDGR